jgi:hypothetical protein
MICPFLSARWQTLAALVLAASAVAVSACSNATTNAAVQPLAKHASGPLPYTFTYHSIDDTSGTNTAVRGISDSQEIVGTYSMAVGSTSITQSFTSTPDPSKTYGSFVSVNYPQPVNTASPPSTGTDLVAINPGAMAVPTVEAGWVVNPGGFDYNLGLVNNQGLWTALHDFGEGSASCKEMELNGINDADTAVGFYHKETGIACVARAFVAKPGENYSDYEPVSSFSASVATGIGDPDTNGKVDVVGWGVQPSSAVTVGWYQPKAGGALIIIKIPNHTSAPVQALGINAAGNKIVGSYTVGNTTYGFLCTAPCKYSTDFQTIQPFSSPDTIVYGINDNNEICGSWVDPLTMKQYGFVATSQAKRLRRRAEQSHALRPLQAPSAGPSL